MSVWRLCRTVPDCCGGVTQVWGCVGGVRFKGCWCESGFVTVVCYFPLLVVGYDLRGLYLWLLLLHLILAMFRAPGQGDMDMMEGRSPNNCGRYVVSCVARR